MCEERNCGWCHEHTEYYSGNLTYEQWLERIALRNRLVAPVVASPFIAGAPWAPVTIPIDGRRPPWREERPIAVDWPVAAEAQ